MTTDDDIMAIVLAAFQEEQAEHRLAAGQLLLDLERDPDHPQRRERLDQLFREAHSLKGGARAANLPEVEQLAHRMEDIFSAVRSGHMQFTPDICDPIYAALDAIGALMRQVAVGEPPDLTPYQTLLEYLTSLHERAVTLPQEQAAETPPEAATEDLPVAQTSEDAPAASKPAHKNQKQAVASPAEPQEPTKAEASPPAVLTPSPAPQAEQSNTNGTVTQQAVPQQTRVPATEKAIQRTGEQSPPPASPDSGGSMTPMPEPLGIANTTVRLSTNVLDGLLNEAGELLTCTVRARQRAREAREIAELPGRWRRIWRQAMPSMTRLHNDGPTLAPTVHYIDDRKSETNGWVPTGSSAAQWQSRSSTAPLTHANRWLEHDISTLLDTLNQANTMIAALEQQLVGYARQVTDDHDRLATVTDRLHDQVHRTRMLPVATLFSPLRLQIRDMLRESGKQAEVILDDGGAQADRQVLEQLRDVLLHLLRNAIDHGIESADDRKARGKHANGLVRLRAEVRGDRLVLTLEDDGAGLDLPAIKRRALAGGLMTSADLERSSDTTIADLIFLPGFSTRQKVSTLSGRGVGLDVVRSHVERMHGWVQVHSQDGLGTTFTISIPLSLTSTHGLRVRVGPAIFMLPLDAVQRIMPIRPPDIQILEGRPAYVLDDRPLAVIHLADVLGLGHHGSARADRPAAEDDRQTGLLLGTGERQIICVVNTVLGQQDLVVQRLPAPLVQVRFVAGASILEDGSVVPILDVVDVLHTAIGARQGGTTEAMAYTKPRQRTVLVVDDSITTRMLEKNILQAAGYRVELAIDGAEALEVLARLMNDGGCDLLLSDVDMPRLNGIELTTRVRADNRLKHLPVVLVTSLDTPADRERGIAAGADAYIVKRAFDQQSLLETIERMI